MIIENAITSFDVLTDNFEWAWKLWQWSNVLFLWTDIALEILKKDRTLATADYEKNIVAVGQKTYCNWQQKSATILEKMLKLLVWLKPNFIVCVDITFPK